MPDPGNFMIVIDGDDEAARWLRGSASGAIDDLLYQVVDQITFIARDRLVAHGPDSLEALVDVDLPHQLEPGVIQGIAGVEPDFSEESFGRGLGSDPADWPVFYDVGTGIFGPVGEPISTIPGHYMAFIGSSGNLIFAHIVQGQRPKHFSDRAFEDTVALVPGVLEQARLEFKE